MCAGGGRRGEKGSKEDKRKLTPSLGSGLRSVSCLKDVGSTPTSWQSWEMGRPQGWPLGAPWGLVLCDSLGQGTIVGGSQGGDISEVTNPAECCQKVVDYK